MNDTSTMWDEAISEARAIATQVVVPLRSEVTGEPLTQEQRDTIIIQTMLRALMQFQIGRRDNPATLKFLDDLDTDLAALRFEMRVQQGLVGPYGRAP